MTDSSDETPSETDSACQPADLLLVEDELMIALEMQDLVEEEGLARVHVAGSEATARAMLPDLSRLAGVILDINLAGGTSLSFAAELQGRKIPIAFATAYDPSAEFLARFSEVPLIAKPFESKELFATINMLLAAARAEDG